MITNEKMAVRTAKNIVSLLREKGVKCESDFAVRAIDETLRNCWYVNKLKQCGATDCIYINLTECGGFLAVTNDCKLMSGMNCMVQDAIYSILLEYVEVEYPEISYEYIFGRNIKLYSDDWGDNGMFILEPFAFNKWISCHFFIPQEC